MDVLDGFQSSGPISFNGHRQNCTCAECRHGRRMLKITDTTRLYEVLPTLPKQRAPEWATWVASRNPEWKQHAHLGHAKNALHSSGHGVLYRYRQAQGHPQQAGGCASDSGATLNTRRGGTE